MYQATAKNTGDPVSVFVLDKDELRASGMPKNEREQLLDIMRRDVKTLKEMDHPRVLKVVEVRLLLDSMVAGDSFKGGWG